MEDSLKALLDLQEVDLARDRLEERKEHLPEKRELSDLEGRMAEVQAAIDRVRESADYVVRESDRLEGEIGTLDEKIGKEEGRLYSGEVANPKELSALQEEIAMLKRRKQPLEDSVLEHMVTREELSSERERLQAELEEIRGNAERVRERMREALGALDGELAAEQEKRGSLVRQIPEDVIELYESLREQKRGIGAGALEGGICTACREALPAMEVDRIRRKVREGERLFRCEHCRRILVVS